MAPGGDLHLHQGLLCGIAAPCDQMLQAEPALQNVKALPLTIHNGAICHGKSR